MQRIVLAAIAALALICSARAELNWGTDLKAALEQAKKENKMVVMDFTGSDWCSFCVKLKKEVFDTKEFGEYAKKNLVLVEVDFPRGKKQSAALEKANQELAVKYKPNGYPTIVVLNGDGKELWRNSGHNLGGPSAWIAKLDEAKKK